MADFFRGVREALSPRATRNTPRYQLAIAPVDHTSLPSTTSTDSLIQVDLPSPGRCIDFEKMPRSVQNLYRTTEQLQAAKSDLEDVKSQRSCTPNSDLRLIQQQSYRIEQLVAKIAYLEQQQVEDHAKLTAYEVKLWNQTVSLNQQADTIKIQSEQIQKGSNRNGRSEASSSRQNIYTIGQSSPYNNAGNGMQYNQFGPPLHRHSNSGNSSFNQNVNAGGQQVPGAYATGSSNMQRNYGTNDLSGMAPGFSVDLAASGSTNMSDSLFMSSVPAAPPTTPQPAGNNITIITPRSLHDGTMLFAKESKEAVMAAEFAKLFDMVVDYARMYCNTPSNTADGNAPPWVKAKLLAAATNTTAFSFMASDDSRFWLVTKVMLIFCYHMVFGDDSFSGLDPLLDTNIKNQRAKVVRPAHVPSTVMYVYLKDIVTLYADLKANPLYNAYIKGKISERATKLFYTVLPLMHGGVEGNWSKIYDLVYAAHLLAEKVFLDPAQYQ